MSCLLHQELNTIMWIWGPAPRVHVCVCVLLLCPTLSNSTDCGPPGSSVRGIFPGKNTGVGC